MNTARKILIFGRLTLATFGMLYGLYYALFVEHQTLDRMGGSLASAFVHAAEGHLSEAESSVESYASSKRLVTKASSPLRWRFWVQY
jgi:hypothetical protein